MVMSKHNRRRTRGGSHRMTMTTPSAPAASSSLVGCYYPRPNTTHPTTSTMRTTNADANANANHSSPHTYPYRTSIRSTSICSPIHISNLNTKIGPSAYLWKHTHHPCRQVHERKQWGDRARLEAEKRRIFGGVAAAEQEEDGLCEKMMEYFGGLGFVE